MHTSLQMACGCGMACTRGILRQMDGKRVSRITEATKRTVWRSFSLPCTGMMRIVTTVACLYARNGSLSSNVGHILDHNLICNKRIKSRYLIV